MTWVRFPTAFGSFVGRPQVIPGLEIVMFLTWYERTFFLFILFLCFSFLFSPSRVVTRSYYLVFFFPHDFSCVVSIGAFFSRYLVTVFLRRLQKFYMPRWRLFFLFWTILCHVFPINKLCAQVAALGWTFVFSAMYFLFMVSVMIFTWMDVRTDQKGDSPFWRFIVASGNRKKETKRSGWWVETKRGIP